MEIGMGKQRDLAEQAWSGGIEPRFLIGSRDSEEIAPSIVFIRAFANATLVETGGGPLLIDTGGRTGPTSIFDEVRRRDPRPLAAVVYTHGHLDHTAGMALFIAEAEDNGWPRPKIVGHRNIAARFDRYRATAGYNGRANSRQFGVEIAWPTDHAYPDTVYDDRLDLAVGEIGLELNHARGETDDHTWIWWPERAVLWTGDLFIWTMPNAGNPQKSQRYAAEWASALRAMAAKDAELLIPGHGPPIFGRDPVRQALSETAEWLESMVEQTLAMMNTGLPLEAILAAVKPPAHLATRPYLQPTYDEPSFVIRNIWRLAGGWYDGTPSHLKPAALADLGAEWIGLAGGLDALVERARHLAAENKLDLACHLIDWAVAARPADKPAHRVRAAIYIQRARASRALQTRSIYLAAAKDSEAIAGAEADPASATPSSS